MGSSMRLDRLDVNTLNAEVAARLWARVAAWVEADQIAYYIDDAPVSSDAAIYAWQGSEDRPAAAGVLIETTASGSDGTLGGLVDLSNTDKFEQIMTSALQEMKRCSSDPVCARRIPKDPEDFLHGAACHCCCMLSETSCERANRFLDRRFLVPLPGQDASLAFFKD